MNQESLAWQCFNWFSNFDHSTHLANPNSTDFSHQTALTLATKQFVSLCSVIKQIDCILLAHMIYSTYLPTVLYHVIQTQCFMEIKEHF